jgi:hypothetical protein
MTFLSLQLTEAKINTFITIGSPLGIPIVISKIAAEYKEKFSKDFIPSIPKNIIKNWFNFSDLRDKVAMNYNLATTIKKIIRCESKRLCRKQRLHK